MIYYEQEICDLDSKPKEMSELYRLLNELDPVAAQKCLYTIEVPLGKAEDG